MAMVSPAFAEAEPAEEADRNPFRNVPFIQNIWQGLWPGGYVLTPSGTLEKEKKLLVFGTLDSGPGQVFSGAGVKYAPFGPLDASGFRILAKGGLARWQERREVANNQGRMMRKSEIKGEGHVMLGAESMTGRGAFSLYLGPETAMSWQGSPQPGKPASILSSGKLRNGLRIQAEIWDHPTPGTLLQLSGAISSAKGEAWGRAAAGINLGHLHPVLDAFAGPEAEGTVAGNYTKWRYGLHVTGVKMFNMQFRVSAGREQASDRARGVYVTAGLQWAR